MLSAFETLIIVFIALIPFTLMIVAIADVVNKQISGIEKALWLLLIVFFAIIGPILYFIFNKGVFKLHPEN